MKKQMRWFDPFGIAVEVVKEPGQRLFLVGAQRQGGVQVLGDGVGNGLGDVAQFPDGIEGVAQGLGRHRLLPVKLAV